MSDISVFTSISPLSSVDGTKFQVIADRLSNNATLLEKVKSNETTIDALAKDAGISVPDGWHLHIADENNQYYPSEGDSGVQIGGMPAGELWNRAEFRYGSGQIACIVCFWCKKAEI